MLNACLIVIIIVNTTGPNSSIVENINSCPIAEHIDVANACTMNRLCFCMKNTQSKNVSLRIRDVEVKTVEIQLTKNII